MTFKNDTRGVSEVVGAILVFGVLIALLAVMQTQAVPAANQQVEFEHTQDAQGDLVKFHQFASEVANSGDGQSVSIEAGTGYPTRLLFFNPPRVQGSLSTSENRTVTIQNAEATQPEVRDYLNGSNVTLDTRTFRYDVSYNELQNAPQVRYEYGVLYNQFENDTTIQNPGSVIDDTDINLVFMMGDYSRTSGDTQSLDVRPVSAPARPVTIEGHNGNNITLVLPTDLPVEEWEELYQSQSTVLNISEGPRNGTVQIDLDGDERYTIRMAGLGLEQGVEKPEEHYIVPIESSITAGAGQETTATFEVRDEFNNPVSGANVTLTIPEGIGVPDENIQIDENETYTDTTDSEGRVSVPITAQDTENLDADLDNCSEERCETSARVQVTDLEINPSAGVTLEGASTDGDFLGISLGGNPSQVDVAFQATEEERQISRIRINHYQSNTGSPPENATFSDNQAGSDDVSLRIGGGFKEVPSDFKSVSDTDETAYLFDFDNNADAEDFFVVTVIFEDGERALYFIAPTD